MDLFEKYCALSFKCLSYRPRSEKEVKDYLTKKRAPNDIIARVLTFLKEKKFLDDVEFTKWWIEQRNQFRSKGSEILKFELKQKGISAAIIQKFYTKSSEIQKIDLENAKKFIERKARRIHLTEKAGRLKLMHLLSRRGYRYDTITKAIDEFIEKGV